jgi:phospholipid-binding lipoprotein MlaA
LLCIGTRNVIRRAQGWVNWAVASALPLVLGACAGVPRDASLPINDPHEQINRSVMAANQEVLRPASVLVDAVIPGPIHDRLRDFNSNLKEPRIFVNNVLQGRVEAAVHTGARFAINSALGVAGLFDIASREGLRQESGDFGQTLFVWGLAEGPYVVRPWLGPATLRDAAGSIVDMFADPVGWAVGSRVVLSVSASGLDAAERLGQLKQAEDASIDFYSFVRSSYYQTRRAELREAIGLPNVVDSPALDDPDAPELASAASAQSLLLAKR